jgi:hypothetical protein
MAFQKQITTRGTSGNYIRAVAWRMDDNTHEASILFGLYIDKAHSDRCRAGEDRALLDVVAKLRVRSAKYDAAFGGAARKGAAQVGKDVVALFYEQAKAVSIDRKGKPHDDREAQVISDFGGDVFADATEV